MPVFDFSGASDKKTGVQSECTYTTFQSNEKETSPEKPIMILDNSSRQWKHHSCGIFTNPIKRTSFEFKEDDGVFSADIISIDSRFVSLLKWLGENHINVRLSGENKENGYAVYKIRETAFGGGTKLSAEDGFLQFMIERLLASSAPAEIVEDEDEEETGDEMKLTSIQSITDFMTCAGRTLPDNIRLWARRNLAVARSHEVSPEERRHAQRALSIMMNVQWKSNYFEAIEVAKKENKPVLIDFTGYGCENCRKMEEFVWSQDDVLPILQNDLIIASVYVDDKEELPEYAEWKYQCSAYVKLWNEHHPENPINSACIVAIAKDTVAYKKIEMNEREIDDCFNEVFLSCLKIINYQKRKDK